MSTNDLDDHDAIPDTVPSLRAAARRTGGFSRSVPHAEVIEAVVHIDEQAKEIAKLRAAVATRNGLAASIAQMVTEWVDAGIALGTDWRPGLARIIGLRMARFSQNEENL